jgi:hypothetical protein
MDIIKAIDKFKNNMLDINMNLNDFEGTSFEKAVF